MTWSWIYLAALLVSLTGMVVLDVRFGLFFARSPWRAGVVLATGIAFFLVWDVAGISHGIFFRGDPELLTGVLLGPELPLEELFFLALLGYTVMNAYGAASSRRSSPRRSALFRWSSSRRSSSSRWSSSRRSRRTETPPTPGKQS